MRARQTAEILATAVPAGLPLIVLPELDPESGLSDLIAVLAPLLESESHTLLVGHQPLLGDLVKALSGETVGLSAGALVRIQTPEPLVRGRGRVVATLQPPTYR